MAQPRFLADEGLLAFLNQVPGDRRFVNVSSDGIATWSELDAAEPTEIIDGLRGARPFFSFKGVLMPAAELVARYGRAGADPLEHIAATTVAVIGARGCECRALAYLDKVMLDEPMADPFYETRRGNLFVVGVDCAVAAESCFCNLLGEAAYPEVNCALNLSPIDGGFLVEAGDEKGEQVLDGAADLLADPTAEQVEGREAMRRRAAEQLVEQNADYAFPEDIAKSLAGSTDEAFWRQELARCVQCGGCTAVCPQCYCFLLYDQAAAEEGVYERSRVWDSCQFTGYSEMAGPPGMPKPDPRRQHMSKFQHRFEHKFWYNPAMLGMLGCVGCGRCGETCPGAIDLRRVISEVNRAYAEHD